jgi:hypothetical protein
VDPIALDEAVEGTGQSLLHPKSQEKLQTDIDKMNRVIQVDYVVEFSLTITSNEL